MILEITIMMIIIIRIMIRIIIRVVKRIMIRIVIRITTTKICSYCVMSCNRPGEASERNALRLTLKRPVHRWETFSIVLFLF